jgi:mono/diheme cytochrome c family protein
MAPPGGRASIGGSMKLLTNALMILVAVLVASSSAALAAGAQDAALIAKGEKVYDANKCATCHFIEAKGKGNKKGPLDGVGTKLTADEIREWLVNAPEMTKKTKSTRKPFMKSYKLPKEDIDALVAYMQSLKKK